MVFSLTGPTLACMAGGIKMVGDCVASPGARPDAQRPVHAGCPGDLGAQSQAASVGYTIPAVSAARSVRVNATF
jgi:hypothetical protein